VDPVSCDALADEAASELQDALEALDLTCQQDADCRGVDQNTCVDTCGTVVVGNTESMVALPDLVDAACAPFDAACERSTAPCPTIGPNTDSYCSGGQCVVGTRPMDCYGPERNLDVAYDGGLPGCPCEDVGGLCNGSVALICSDGSWQAVQDGPCDPAVREQACDARLDSAEMCVELFDTCFDLSTGRFCGAGRRTSLCDAGELVESSADCLFDSAFCVELENGLYCTGSWAGGGITPDECLGRGGEVFSDFGDGSLTECPDGRATLASVDGCVEGCLCCGFQP
jgi:hypothetical protein